MYLKSAQQFDDTCFSHLYKDRRTPLFYVTLKSKACRKINFFLRFQPGICQNHFTLAGKNTILWKS